VCRCLGNAARFWRPTASSSPVEGGIGALDAARDSSTIDPSERLDAIAVRMTGLRTSRASHTLCHQNVMPAWTIDIREHADRHLTLSAIESAGVFAPGRELLQAAQYVRKKIHSEQVRAAEIVVGAEPDRADFGTARLILQSLH
jgi:hypothetical protein